MRGLHSKRKGHDAVMNEIRTLTLRFANRETARRFYDLAERLGHRPSNGWDGVWHTVGGVSE
jgi:hypothetical protein